MYSNDALKAYALHYLTEHSEQEAAADLDIPMETLRMWQQQALEERMHEKDRQILALEQENAELRRIIEALRNAAGASATRGFGSQNQMVQPLE